MKERNTVDLIIEAATSFYNESKEDANGRYRSWEHCYKQFHDARNNPNVDCDYLSLHLAFYLASWGMYRGSSFLLQKDYKVHIPVVKEILDEKNDCLFGIECKELRNQTVQQRLVQLEKSMSNYYDGIRKEKKDPDVKNRLSTTLITKILMGTLGCAPAYDRYFVEGIKSQKITTGNYNINSLLRLVDFYEENRDEFENIRKGFRVYDLQYPQMKMLDMGFWKMGYDKDFTKEKTVPA